MLTDMLLGFLSEGSQLWRSVVEQVFRMVATHLTPSAMQLIVKVCVCLGGGGGACDAVW